MRALQSNCINDIVTRRNSKAQPTSHPTHPALATCSSDSAFVTAYARAGALDPGGATRDSDRTRRVLTYVPVPHQRAREGRW
jgi:hypothetical protein